MSERKQPSQEIQDAACPRGNTEQKIWEMHAAVNQLVVEKYLPHEKVDWGNWRSGQIFCVEYKQANNLCFDWYIVDKHSAQKILVAQNSPEMRLTKDWLNKTRLGEKINLPARVDVTQVLNILQYPLGLKIDQVYRIMPAGTKLKDKIFNIGLIKALLWNEVVSGTSIDELE